MIVVDTSALLAIILNEAYGSECKDALHAATSSAMTAATLTEALIVARGRSVHLEVEQLIRGAGIEIVPLSDSLARQAADAYNRWGKGYHAAKLNYGDTFAYALAKERGCPLLFVGNDFARTDVVSALAMAPRA